MAIEQIDCAEGQILQKDRIFSWVRSINAFSTDAIASLNNGARVLTPGASGQQVHAQAPKGQPFTQITLQGQVSVEIGSECDPFTPALPVSNASTAIPNPLPVTGTVSVTSPLEVSGTDGFSIYPLPITHLKASDNRVCTIDESSAIVGVPLSGVGSTSVMMIGGADKGTNPRRLAMDSAGRPSAPAVPNRQTWCASLTFNGSGGGARCFFQLDAGTNGARVHRVAVLNPGSMGTASLLNYTLVSATAINGTSAANVFKLGNFTATTPLATLWTNSTNAFTASPFYFPVWTPTAAGAAAPVYLIGGPGADAAIAATVYVPSGSCLAGYIPAAGGHGGATVYVEWSDIVETEAN